MLLVAAAFLFSAGPERLGLKTFDDCRYARKGLEMSRSGGFLEPTWAGRPDFGYPPLQFWIIGRSMSVFGDSDFAATLPSMLMGLGIMAATFWIGRLTVGRGAAVAGLSLLVLTPLFTNHARRCMTELPLAFWTTMAFLVFLAGLKRPKLHLLFAIPLGAAILTKSVLGLLPLIVIPAALVSPDLRRSLRNPWFWGGVAGGLGLGAIWPLHHALRYGRPFLETHFMTTVLSRVSGTTELPHAPAGYPRLLWNHYQPLILPAVLGLGYALWRRWRAGEKRADFIVLWFVLPTILYSFAAWRTHRYLFPVLPALALLSGHIIARKARPLAPFLSMWLAPAILLAGGVAYWITPELLTGHGDAELRATAYKEYAATARAIIPAGARLPFVGDPREGFWKAENIVMRYWDAEPLPASPPREAVAGALREGHRLVLVERERLAGIDSLGVDYEVKMMSNFGLVEILEEDHEAPEGPRRTEVEGSP